MISAPRLLLPVSLLWLTACAAPSAPHNVFLDEQNRCPQSLTIGQTLLLTLPSNPTTGFRWNIVDPAAAVVQSVGAEAYNAGNDDGIVGSAGHSTWRFLAKTAGTAHLKLLYRQPWATDVAAAQSFDCELQVH